MPTAHGAHVNELVASFRDRYGRLGYAENTLYPHVTRGLATLRERGATMGVCTAKRRDFAVRILEMFEIVQYFDFVDGGDVGIRKADQLAGLLTRGEVTREAVMIGDRGSDIEAAQANGLPSAGVLWGFGSRQEIVEAAPDAILHTPADLADTLAIMAR